MTNAAGALSLLRWTLAVPLLALVVLALAWGRDLPGYGLALVGICLAGAVLAAVHHAEVIAHRVGEPFGTLVLAVAVTLIEVGLIITLMASGGPETDSLARDTVFAAVMITGNGVVGVSLLVASMRYKIAVFNAEGAGALLATVITLATLSLVLPRFTSSEQGPKFSSEQLAFAGVVSLLLYGVFVMVQTMRHREHFLPPARGQRGSVADDGPRPSKRGALLSGGLLLTALVAVVGNAKLASPALKSGVQAAQLPAAVVGVAVALLVLMPEALTAMRAARRDEVQTSLNLAYGSAVASIGLTIPAIAFASIWMDGELLLGLDGVHMVLLVLTALVGTLTVVSGRATLLQAGVHLVIFAAFVFLAFQP